LPGGIREEVLAETLARHEGGEFSMRSGGGPETIGVDFVSIRKPARGGDKGVR
jgi:hypothetical protein